MLFWNFFFPIFRDYPFRYSPTIPPCDEWEIISQSWTFWALLLVTLASGFVLSMLIMLRVKRKLFSRLRTNNNTTISRGTSGVITAVQATNTGSGSANHHHLHHPHPQHHSSRDSISHRHSGTSTGSLLAVSRGQHGNGGGCGGSSSNSSSSHLLHGANGTRLISSANTGPPGGGGGGAGSNVPIEL